MPQSRTEPASGNTHRRRAWRRSGSATLKRRGERFSASAKSLSGCVSKMPSGCWKGEARGLEHLVPLVHDFSARTKCRLFVSSSSLSTSTFASSSKSRAEVPHVYREQSCLHSQLWPAVSKRRDDFNGVRGVHGNYVLSKQFVKKQSMQWTEARAHLLLQTCVKDAQPWLASTFRHWYPDFQIEKTAPLAA